MPHSLKEKVEEILLAGRKKPCEACEHAMNEEDIQKVLSLLTQTLKEHEEAIMGAVPLETKSRTFQNVPEENLYDDAHTDGYNSARSSALEASRRFRENI